ncbi:MAG: hypothetical protein ACXV5Q_01305 [Frankiaceae bacterium]
MNPHRTRARLLRELRHVALGWSLLCAVGATVGAVVGVVTMGRE